MSLNIDLRLLRASVALADELNYRRAAVRVHISQSALTKQIRELEVELGFPLFERDKRHVALLDSGKAFVEQARTALKHCELAIHLARAASQSAPRSIVVGRSPYTGSDLVRSLLGVRVPSIPGLQLRLESAFAPQLMQSLVEGALDLALVTGVPEESGITQIPLRKTRLKVAMPVDHPAAKEPSVRLRDLGDTCWALFSKQYHPWIYEAVMRTASEEEIAIPEVQHVISADEGYELVEDRRCISFVPDTRKQSGTKVNLVVRHLEDPSLEFDTSLLMRTGNQSEVVRRFTRAYVKKCGASAAL